MDKLPVGMKKAHNQDLCSMCKKLGRKCSGLVEEDVSDDEKTKLDEPTHRVIRKDGIEFKVRGGFVGARDRGNGATLIVSGLSCEVSEEEVKNFLREKIPNVQRVHVPFDEYEYEIKGFAYVQLASDADVTSVIDQVSDLRMGDRFLNVKPRDRGRPFGGGSFRDRNYSDDFDGNNNGFGFGGNGRRVHTVGGTLYVGGIPLGASETEVRKFLHEKIPNVDYVRVPINSETNEIKGIAFVELLRKANIINIALQIHGLKMDGNILTIKDNKPKREEMITRDLSRTGFGGCARGRYRGRGGYMNRTGFEGRRYAVASGIEDVNTDNNDAAYLIVHGLPFMNYNGGFSKPDVEDFLMDEIPHAEEVRIVTNMPLNMPLKFGGNGPRAWVRLKAGTNVGKVLRQVDGLHFNDKRLQIDESIMTWDIFESIDGCSDDEDITGYLVTDSTDSDDSTKNLGVVFSSLDVDDRRSTNVRKPDRSTRINSVSSARSLRSNSGSGFGRDANGNFVGDRGNGDVTDNDNSSIKSYEPDDDPEKYHW